MLLSPLNYVMIFFLDHLNMELYFSQLRATPPLPNILYVYDSVPYPSPSKGSIEAVPTDVPPLLITRSSFLGIIPIGEGTRH